VDIVVVVVRSIVVEEEEEIGLGAAVVDVEVVLLGMVVGFAAARLLGLRGRDADLLRAVETPGLYLSGIRLLGLRGFGGGSLCGFEVPEENLDT